MNFTPHKQKPKHFQINVSILEGRHLSVTNASVLVKVSIDKQEKTVYSKTKKTSNPYFNELCHFSFYEQLKDLLKHTLRVAVHRKTNVCLKSTLIGQCDIELTTIWQESNHLFHNKWIVLLHPKDDQNLVKGYLKCNLHILAEDEPSLVPRSTGRENYPIEENLITPLMGRRRQKAYFLINIYRADGIVCRKKLRSYKHMYIKITFAGHKRQTKVIRNTISPVWNECLTFIESVPSTFQTITIQLYDKLNGHIGTSNLNISDLSSDTETLMDFGPAFIYLYDNAKKSDSKYIGRLLISIKCNLPDKNTFGELSTFPIVPIDENRILPTYTEYTLFTAIFQAIFFGKKYLKKEMELSVKIGGEVSVGNTEFKIDLETNAINFGKLKVLTSCYTSVVPTKTILYTEKKVVFPGLHYKELAINNIEKLVADTEKLLQKDTSNPKNLLNSIKPIFQQISNLAKDFKGKLKLVNTEVEKFCAEISKMPKHLVVENIKEILKNIKENLKDPTPTFPDIEIELSNKEVVLLTTKDYLFGDKKEECGIECGQTESIWFRNDIDVDTAMLDLFVWFGESTKIDSCMKMLMAAKNKEEILPSVVQSCFELRVHIYQGRINPGPVASGLIDPFVRILTCSHVRETQVKAQTLDPFWDETLLISKVLLQGSPAFIKKMSVGVVFEILDSRGTNAEELVGRGVGRPKAGVREEKYVPPRLQWHKVHNFGEETGEILLAMELLEVDQNKKESLISISRTKVFAIPDEIRPHFQLHRLDVVFWGLRSFVHSGISPKMFILLECNGVRLESNIIKASTSQNFDSTAQTADVLLPEELEYSPPIIAELYEVSHCRKMIYKACCILPSALNFKVTQKSSESYGDKIQSNGKEKPPKKTIQDKPEGFPGDSKEWWTRYYQNKLGQVNDLVIYDSELENQAEFQGFHDFLCEFPLHRVKGSSKKPEKSKEQRLATFKGAIKLQEVPNDFSKPPPSCFNSYPSNAEIQITVRVYLIAAFNLAETDYNGRCDPYITLQLGKTKISDRKNYIYKDINPIFGKFFEIKAVFPRDHTLIVRIKDHDCGHCDDLIGGTMIDLENRFYSSHRGACGLPKQYMKDGPSLWRNLYEPMEIVNQVCEQNGLQKPQSDNVGISIGDFKLSKQQSESSEDVALRFLRTFNNFPKIGYHLVPEHIETRSLFHPKKPNIEQGKLEMWVDILPGHVNLPPPLDISPKPPERMELRVTVFSTADVPPKDYSYITGESSSDIFVKAWLTSRDSAQQTDIHYKSMTGDGSFNWRFIFPFEYSDIEHKMIVRRPFSCAGDTTVEKIPCTLEVQVWDNDLILANQFIGFLTLDLWDMPKGTKTSRRCNLRMLDKEWPRIDLFKVRKTRGWWPMKTKDKMHPGQYKIAGKVDLELEVLTSKEAVEMPAGLGRQPPQALVKPMRLNTAFNWFINPLTILKQLTFSLTGRRTMLSLMLCAVVVFVVVGVYSIPGWIAKKIIDA